MSITSYTADELFQRLTSPSDDFLLVDVRNPTEYARFQVEGPAPFEMINVPYMEFIEKEDESVAKVPTGKDIHIVCAKEGSAKYVAEILDAKGHKVRYLAGGIKSWGNVLIPRQLPTPGADYELYQFLRPGKASCSYGLLTQSNLLLFDPSRNVDFYKDFANQKGASLITTCETHLQADYIAGSRLLAADLPLTFYANDADFQGAAFTYTSLDNGQAVADLPPVTALFTPGHTPGSTCYHIDDRYLVSGDTVFVDSVGRPDLGGKVDEWSGYLFNTLRNVILALPEETTILPAHYADWSEAGENMLFTGTLGEIIERNANIYRLASVEDFTAFIKDNMREQPPEYARIRRVNAGLEEVDDEEQEVLDLGKNECAASALHK